MYWSKELEEYAGKLRVFNVNGIEPVKVTENMKDVFHKVVSEKEVRIIGIRQSGKSLISRIVESYMFDLGYNIIHLNRNVSSKYYYHEMKNFLFLNGKEHDLAASNLHLKMYSFKSSGTITFKNIDGGVNENYFRGQRKTVVIAEDLDCYNNQDMNTLTQIKNCILGSGLDDMRVITTESLDYGRKDIIAV